MNKGAGVTEPSQPPTPIPRMGVMRRTRQRSRDQRRAVVFRPAILLQWPRSKPEKGNLAAFLASYSGLVDW